MIYKDNLKVDLKYFLVFQIIKIKCFNKIVLKLVLVFFNKSNIYCRLSYIVLLNFVFCYFFRFQEVGLVQLYGGFRDSNDFDRDYVLIFFYYVFVRQEAGGVGGGVDQ